MAWVCESDLHLACGFANAAKNCLTNNSVTNVVLDNASKRRKIVNDLIVNAVSGMNCKLQVFSDDQGLMKFLPFFF